MRVLIAPDSFTGTLTAPEAAQALADGWHRHAPADDLDLCPLSDGGPGFIDVLHGALGGRLLPVEVSGPLGEPALAVVLLTNDGTAYLESAQAVGLALVPAEQRNPGPATSFGLGTLVAAALESGAARLVIGLGGSATNDGGAGMLAGLASALELPGAADLTAVLARGGEGLRGVTADQLRPLADLPERLRGVPIVAASDVDVVLLGFKGASAIFGAQKGATPEQAQQLDLALSDFARAALDVMGPRHRRPLDVIGPGQTGQTGRNSQRLVVEPGAGAAGGLGFGLFLLGATRQPGAGTVAEAVGLSRRIRAAGVVVTGEGSLDWQSLRGKVVSAVAQLALEIGVPTVAVAGQVLVGRRELLSVGVESAYPVARTPEEIVRSLADPAGCLADRAERVARTWSPQR